MNASDIFEAQGPSRSGGCFPDTDGADGLGRGRHGQSGRRTTRRA